MTSREPADIIVGLLACIFLLFWERTGLICFLKASGFLLYNLFRSGYTVGWHSGALPQLCSVYIAGWSWHVLLLSVRVLHFLTQFRNTHVGLSGNSKLSIAGNVIYFIFILFIFLAYLRWSCNEMVTHTWCTRSTWLTLESWDSLQLSAG